MHKNNKSKGFEITQERIDVMKKAAKYVKQIDNIIMLDGHVIDK